ncbi:MAG: radical SAM protein [Geobacteraceae bacterium]|nr:radical SAM protein [Geobacteraceae bacterium]
MDPSEAVKILRQQGVRPPKTLTLAITGACNLRCRHCWVGAGESSSAPHVPELALRRLLAEFAALGGEGVRFTGGEPLCHPGWQGLMQFARELGFERVALQTNAMLLGDGEVAALRGLDFPGLSLEISLDGATAPSHDLVRGEGAFAGALAGIGRLARGGLARRIALFFTEMRHNLEEIPELLALAEGLGVGSVATGALVRCGRAAEGAALAPAGTEQYLRLLERYEKEPRFRELYRKRGKVAALEWLTESSPRPECCTFVENPYLTPAGTLYPCVLCHADRFAVSGVFERGLADAFAAGAPLWATLLRISRSRAELAQCQDCPGRLACAGGCMGRAWGSCGDLQAADDRCELRRAIHGLAIQKS